MFVRKDVCVNNVVNHMLAYWMCVQTSAFVKYSILYKCEILNIDINRVTSGCLEEKMT